MAVSKPLGSLRDRRVLAAVVSEYIATAEPVGSRALAKRHGLELSPASIRSVLADLEEAGYLSQPHTSAGRVPTEAGFRSFVDALAETRALASLQRETIVTRLRSLGPGLHDLMREAARLLSTMTGAVALVAAPRASEEVLQELRFVPLRQDAVLAVLVTRSGAVENRIVELRRSFEQGDLERVHNYLSTLVDGRTLHEVRDALAREVEGELREYHALRRSAQELVGATLHEMREHAEVLIEGQRRLCDWPELADLEKLRGYLRTFDERRTLLELLERTVQSRGVQVFIGSETKLTEVDDVSVISANYQGSGESLGALGVVGPSRMDYARIMPIVEFTAQTVSGMLASDGQGGNDGQGSDEPNGS